VHDSKSHDLFDKGRLTQQIFIAIFHTFTMGTTDLCLRLVENVKRVKN
jgi:hypothetical protein